MPSMPTMTGGQEWAKPANEAVASVLLDDDPLRFGLSERPQLRIRQVRRHATAGRSGKVNVRGLRGYGWPAM
jgi:hypothetical protein